MNPGGKTRQYGRFVDMLSRYSSFKPSSKDISSNRFKCRVLIQHSKGFIIFIQITLVKVKIK